MAGKERRNARRFKMKLPLMVTWVSGSAPGELPAETNEVSSRGVYFYMQKDLKKGMPIQFLMTLPHDITRAGPVKVRCLGRVVRTDAKQDHKMGIVVAIERYEFMRGDKHAA